MTHPKEARAILISFECREQCAEKGEPPCYDLDAREGNDGPPAPCDLCQRLTDARLAALAEAEVKCVGREPTREMVVAEANYVNAYEPLLSLSRVLNTAAARWRAMWDAASEPEQSERSQQVREGR